MESIVPCASPTCPALPADDPAEVLLASSMQEADVEVQWDDRPPAYPPEMVAEADRYWHRLCGERGVGAFLFDGPLCALQSFHLQSQHLVLCLGRTSYRYALFANAYCSDIVQRWGREHLPQVLGVSAVVVTSDGTLPLMRRSDAVGEFPGLLDVFGGHIDPEADLLHGLPHPFAAIRNELAEELALTADHLISLRCIGIIRSRCNQKPELIFACQVPVDFPSLLEAGMHARGAGEFVEFLHVADEGATLQGFLRTKRADLTPSAYGSLWLYGLHRGFWPAQGEKKS